MIHSMESSIRVGVLSGVHPMASCSCIAAVRCTPARGVALILDIH